MEVHRRVSIDVCFGLAADLRLHATEPRVQLIRAGAGRAATRTVQELARLGASAVVAQERHLREPRLVPGGPAFRARLDDLSPVAEGVGRVTGCCRRAGGSAEGFRRSGVMRQHLLVVSPSRGRVAGAQLEVG